MDPHRRLGAQLRSLFSNLHTPEAARHDLALVMQTARQLGSPLKEEVEGLLKEVEKFLKTHDFLVLESIKKKTLKIEHETRNL